MVNIKKIKIDSGIKFPRRPPLSGNPIAPTMDKLKVGDSFFIFDKDHAFMNARNACFMHARRNGIKIATRTAGEGETFGIRVWRLQ